MTLYMYMQCNCKVLQCTVVGDLNGYPSLVSTLLFALWRGVVCVDVVRKKGMVDFHMPFSVADPEGVPRAPWNPPYGFSCNRKFIEVKKSQVQQA